MFEFSQIGVIHSCFKEKFGVARQSLMMSQALGVLKLDPNPAFSLAVKDLEGFSHVWVLYVFHKNIETPWHPTVNPPRLDGPNRVGVFASRSPHRPNPIGQSALKLERIDLVAKNGIEIHVSGLDILDGSPLLDIKPYLSYADSIPEAKSGWAINAIPKYPVTFSSRSLSAIKQSATSQHPDLKELLVQMLELDPRPTSQRQALPIIEPESEGRKFAFRLFDFDVQWQIVDQGIHVVDLISPRFKQ
ncbi:MAG: tRNA (N6-threonylcarbamoyladenosine(37)-N6)-methyltransferase TrmO [Pseudomonadota bacterium]|nr:tRNA (N6-threonylcarbamoyladenosine(37)-N6)-methyltransferase TrmO [Pseudomonadota bacterium]